MRQPLKESLAVVMSVIQKTSLCVCIRVGMWHHDAHTTVACKISVAINRHENGAKMRNITFFIVCMAMQYASAEH